MNFKFLCPRLLSLRPTSPRMNLAGPNPQELDPQGLQKIPHQGVLLQGVNHLGPELYTKNLVLAGLDLRRAGH